MTFKLPFNLHEDCKIQTVQELVEKGILEPPLDGNHGEKHPTASDYVDKGIPFVMASDLVNGSLDLNNCKFISLKTAETLRKGFALENDVLITHKATIGRTAIVPKLNTPSIVLTPQVTYYRVKNSEILNPNYLKYYFDSDFFQNLLKTWAGAGSTRAYLGITAQLKLPIITPPIHRQNSIVDVIGPINKQIKTNIELNCTLESIAQTIFKSWFIDFDPVHAKVKAIKEGRDPELAAMATIAGKTEAEIQKLKGKGSKLANTLLQLDDLRHIASLFPRKLINSKTGVLPQDCKSIELGNFCSFKYGKTLPAKSRNSNGNIPVYGSNGVIGYHDEAYVNQPGVIIGRKGTVGALQFSTGSFWPIDTTFYIVNDDYDDLLFTYYLLQTLNLNQMNSDSAVPGLNRENAESLIVTILPSNTRKNLTRYLSILYKKIESQSLESNTLSKIRDNLLPKLISGEISINKIDPINHDLPTETNTTECQDGN